MKISLVTPAPAHSRKGNRITAERWARLLRELGHRVTVEEKYSGEPCDVLVALHARRSFASVKRFRRQQPGAPLIVALTGTDLYRDIQTSAQARQSLEMASRLIVLQPLGIAELPEHLRSKAQVIYQSVEKPFPKIQPRKSIFEVGVFGHLRPVKDPFRAAMAARLLPASSRIYVVHAGGALTKQMEKRARAEERANPRYRWFGELPRGKMLRLLARCRAIVLSSKMEGGANVLSEAIVAGVPVLASRISGSIGILGPDYPGYFPVEDTQALAELLLRAEEEPAFLKRLQSWCKPLASLFSPARERQTWSCLLEELSSHASWERGRLARIGTPLKKRAGTPALPGQEPRTHREPRFTLIDCDGGSNRNELAGEVKEGLTSNPKHLSCRFFYDAEGSQLFEAICELPEYYLMRVERAILQEHAAEIAGLFQQSVTLVEFGSGSAAKTRILIEELIRRQGALRYVPMDISRAMLEESSRALLRECPALEIHAIAGEYQDCLRQLNTEQNCARLILWLGSNVGNLDRGEAVAFLRRIRAIMAPDDRFLIGIDLRKRRAVLEPAYDDSAGVTARFNRNILARINRELGGHFNLDSFRHSAVYEEKIGRVEIYLVSMRAQQVSIDDLKLVVPFEQDERIHTENSYKYSLHEIERLARAGGLQIERQWLDAGQRFSLNLLAAVG